MKRKTYKTKDLSKNVLVHRLRKCGRNLGWLAHEIGYHQNTITNWLKEGFPMHAAIMVTSAIQELEKKHKEEEAGEAGRSESEETDE